MYKKAGIGYVLVTVTATHKMDSGFKGVDGKPMMIDIIFDPISYVENNAFVTQIPYEMGHSPINQEPVGSPGYGPIRRPANLEEPCSMDLYAIGGVYKYKFVSDIAPEVEVGDRIYFKKRTLNSKQNCMGTLKGADGKPALYIYKVPYENIFCAVKKDGRIVPIGGWVLVKPIYEDWSDVYRKTYYDYLDRLGNKIERPQKEWIQLKAAPDVDSMRGNVSYIGTPLKGDECDIKPGMTVLFKKMKQVHLSKIEGTDYIVLGQYQILCQLTSQNVKIA
jgi:co-chaperonin GroES (HSP10)